MASTKIGILEGCSPLHTRSLLPQSPGSFSATHHPTDACFDSRPCSTGLLLTGLELSSPVSATWSPDTGSSQVRPLCVSSGMRDCVSLETGRARGKARVAATGSWAGFVGAACSAMRDPEALRTSVNASVT